MSVIELTSSDDKTFPVEESAMKLSIFIQNMLEDTAIDGPIKLSTIDGESLEKIIEFCKYHEHITETTPEVYEWNQTFLTMNDKLLFNVIMAANFLEIKSLLDMGCKKVAEEIRGKSSEEIRSRFNIDEDFNAEEVSEMQNQYPWTQSYS